MKTSCILLFIAHVLTTSAFSERYLVSLSAKLVTVTPSDSSNPSSATRTVSIVQNQRQFISTVLKQTPPPPPLSSDPDDYLLIFDSEKDTLDIAFKIGGAALFSVVQFATVQGITADLSPTKTHRIASMTIPGAAVPTGIAAGVVKTDPFKWKATFSVAVPATVPINLMGSFTTGKALPSAAVEQK
jgi:hypothetical protein